MTISCSPVAERFPESGSSFYCASRKMNAASKPKQIASIKPCSLDVHELSRRCTPHSSLERLSAEVQQLRVSLEQAEIERDMLRNGHRILCLTTIAWGRRRKDARRHGARTLAQHDI